MLGRFLNGVPERSPKFDDSSSRTATRLTGDTAESSKQVDSKDFRRTEHEPSTKWGKWPFWRVPKSADQAGHAEKGAGKRGRNKPGSRPPPVITEGWDPSPSQPGESTKSPSMYEHFMNWLSPGSYTVGESAFSGKLAESTGDQSMSSAGPPLGGPQRGSSLPFFRSTPPAMEQSPSMRSPSYSREGSTSSLSSALASLSAPFYARKDSSSPSPQRRKEQSAPDLTEPRSSSPEEIFGAGGHLAGVRASRPSRARSEECASPNPRVSKPRQISGEL